MRERPILFSGAMVRAILEGRKMQTRRVMKPQPFYTSCQQGDSDALRQIAEVAIRKMAPPCPYGVPGDRLWVRETFRYGTGTTHFYRADEEYHVGAGWKPSIHMPRRASRITLEITEVRVQRLQEISEEDAKDEGVDCWSDSANPARWKFIGLWESINEKRGFGWDTNPWLWALTFRRIDTHALA